MAKRPMYLQHVNIYVRNAERSKKLFDYIKQDKTGDIPKSLCTPTGLPKSVTG